MQVRSIQLAIAVGFLTLAGLVFVIVRWVPFGEYPGESFFELAAQTIPILLVALAVEAHARHFDLEKSDRHIRIAAVIFLSIGEAAAIVVSAALYRPDPGTVASDVFIVVTAVGLLGGFIAVIAVALRPGLASSVDHLMSHEEVSAGPRPTEAFVPRPRRATSVFVSMIVGTILMKAFLSCKARSTYARTTPRTLYSSNSSKTCAMDRGSSTTCR